MSTYAMAGEPGPVVGMPEFAAEWQQAVKERQAAVEGRRFTGMIFPDAQPMSVDDQWVCRVHMFDVPTPLREHADGVLGEASGEWRTIGEFKYAGQAYHDYVTAVARRHRGRIEYGIEGD